MKVFHSDKAMIVGKLTKDPVSGYLSGTAVIAREGILVYNEGGKTVRKLITRDELGKKESLDTLKMKPITNDHPFEMLDSNTTKQYQAGSLGENVGVNDGLLYSPVLITDSQAIKDVEINGKRELSAGYYATIIDQPGVWNGQAYDCIQTDRVYNHVAICYQARAGSVTAMHIDSAIAVEISDISLSVKQIDSVDNNLPQRSHTMKCTINGVAGEFTDEQVIAHIDSLNVTIQKNNKEHKDAIDLVTADRDNFKDKFEKLDKEHKTHVDSLSGKINDAVKARIELERAATPHMDKADVDKIGTLSDTEIRKAVIKKAFPQVEFKDAAGKDVSDVYIQARYDSALDMLKNSHVDSVAAANRQAMNGNPNNDSTGSEGKPASKESSEQKVCDRYKTTVNRDSIMK